MREIDGKNYISTMELVSGSNGLKISRDTLYRLRRSGTIEAYTFIGDKNTYWLVEEIEAAVTKPHKKPLRTAAHEN